MLDVHNGWVAGLRENGCQVVDYLFDNRLAFYERTEAADQPAGPAKLASKSLQSACYEVWPDVVLVTSGFFVDPFTLALMRERRHKVVLLATESPYQDVWQQKVAAHVDLVLLNDPTNLERFQQVNPNTHYMPHAHDPARHHPRQVEEECRSDFCFVGTAYQSRVEFFEQVDWTGVDVAFGGNWQHVPDTSPLLSFLAHERADCLPNEQTVRLYASTKASVNLYRREAENDRQVDGWSMGPREVELAACGTFFLREPRPEGDEVLDMLPTFDSPGEFGERLRWWLAHDTARHEAAAKARAAVADRTFAANAAELLRLLGA